MLERHGVTIDRSSKRKHEVVEQDSDRSTLYHCFDVSVKETYVKEGRRAKIGREKSAMPAEDVSLFVNLSI